MNSQIIDSTKKYDLCLQVVRRLRNLPGFQFLNEDEFVEQILQFIEQQIDLVSPQDIQNFAIRIYSENLYRAITDSDIVQQEAGFQELSRYIYRIAFNFYLGQTLPYDEKLIKAEENTQSALEKIIVHIASVNTPGSFLKWCGIVLRNVCLEEVRCRKSEISIDELNENSILVSEGFCTSLENNSEQICLRAAISRLKKEYQEVILLSYFSLKKDGTKYTDPEIAAQLKISVGNLYTIRSRALALLRKDQKLLECIQGLL